MRKLKTERYRDHAPVDKQRVGSFVLLLLSITGGIGAVYWYAEDLLKLFVKPSIEETTVPLTLPLAETSSSAPLLVNKAPQVTVNESSADTSSQPFTLLPEPHLAVAEVASLPTLENNNASLQDELQTLVPQLAPWLQGERLLPRYAAILNDLAQSQRSARHFRFLKPETPFPVAEDAQGLFLDPKGYQRFDGFADAIASIDAQRAVALFARYRPLLQQALAPLGHSSDEPVEYLINQAIAVLLQAPIHDAPRIGLIPHGSLYRYADPRLESLDPVAKQFLRMGPRNTRIIQRKLREIAAALASNSAG